MTFLINSFVFDDFQRGSQKLKQPADTFLTGQIPATGLGYLSLRVFISFWTVADDVGEMRLKSTFGKH
jgi:hypothetical protein